MNEEEKKLIFDYCGWHRHQLLCVEKYPITFQCQSCGIYVGAEYEEEHHLDGNDKDLAVKVMESNGDLKEFEYFARDKWNEEDADKRIFSYTLQNFFPLMSQWLKDK
jgi:hypothetical protein